MGVRVPPFAPTTSRDFSSPFSSLRPKFCSPDNLAKARSTASALSARSKIKGCAAVGVLAQSIRYPSRILWFRTLPSLIIFPAPSGLTLVGRKQHAYGAHRTRKRELFTYTASTTSASNRLHCTRTLSKRVASGSKASLIQPRRRRTQTDGQQLIELYRSCGLEYRQP